MTSLPTFVITKSTGVVPSGRRFPVRNNKSSRIGRFAEWPGQANPGKGRVRVRVEPVAKSHLSHILLHVQYMLGCWDPVLIRGDDARTFLQRLTFIYLASYLLVGGLGLLAMPELTLWLLLSNGSYGDVMPRLVGVFMVALGGVVLQFVRARDYRYYGYAIIARIFIVVALTVLYFKARDPFFLVLDAIVLVGLLPSIYVAALMTRAATGTST
jgi:hypothetical protein